MCNKRAAVRISKSYENPSKLYYYCKYEQCNFFRFWYPGRSDFEGGSWFDNVGNNSDQWHEIVDKIDDLEQQMSEMNAMMKQIMCQRFGRINCRMLVVLILVLFIFYFHIMLAHYYK